MPAVSVIIPVLNDVNGLARTLASIGRADRPKCEVVVVDNGSSDADRDAMERLVAGAPYTCRLLVEPLRGSYRARNLGIVQSSGEIICFIDAGVQVSGNYFIDILGHFAQCACQYVGAKVIVDHDGRHSYWSLYDTATSFLMQRAIREGHYAPTLALSIRRGLVDVVGHFDPELESGGDVDFGNRVFNHSLELHYLDHIIAYHEARATWAEIAAKKRRVARGLSQRLAGQSGACRRVIAAILSPAPYRPLRPRDVRATLASRGVSISIGTAMMLSLAPIPLAIIRSVTLLRYLVRK